MPHRKRTDNNSREIIGLLRKCGYSALDLSQVGGGCPDWLVAKAGQTALIEIKSAKGQLRQSQVEFHEAWRGRIYVLRSVEDVLAMANDI